MCIVGKAREAGGKKISGFFGTTLCSSTLYPGTLWCQSIFIMSRTCLNLPTWHLQVTKHTLFCRIYKGTVLFIFLSPPRFLLEIRVIIKISKKFLVSHKLWLIWIKIKQKNKFLKILMITLISSKNLGWYKIMKHTVPNLIQFWPLFGLKSKIFTYELIHVKNIVPRSS